jgi:hypothetical protein
MCSAYSNLKNYGKLFPCLDEMQAGIDRGKTALVTTSLPVSGGMGDIRLEYGIMRTRALIELGDYDNVILYGKRVVEFVGPNPVERDVCIQRYSERLCLLQSADGDG